MYCRSGVISIFWGDDVAIGSNFPDVSSSIVVFRWCFGSDLVLFLDVSAVISIDASWKFLILTAWLSGGGLEMLIGMTAGLSFKVLIGMTGGLSLKVLNLFDISIRSSVSKNVVEKFGRPH